MDGSQNVSDDINKSNIVQWIVVATQFTLLCLHEIVFCLKLFLCLGQYVSHLSQLRHGNFQSIHLDRPVSQFCSFWEPHGMVQSFFTSSCQSLSSLKSRNLTSSMKMQYISQSLWVKKKKVGKDHVSHQTVSAV